MAQRQQQQQQQKLKQLEDRQFLLDSVTDTYVTFNNYLDTIASGNPKNTEKANVLMGTVLNGLKGQVALTIMDRDDDALVMAKECAAQKNDEIMAKIMGASQNTNAAVTEDLQRTFQNTTGYINALFAKLNPPPVEAPVIKQMDQNSVNSIGSALVGAMNHGVPNRVNEVRSNPAAVKKAHNDLLKDSQKRMRSGAANTEYNQNTNFNAQFLNHHVKSETSQYRGGNKGKNTYSQSHSGHGRHGGHGHAGDSSARSAMDVDGDDDPDLSGHDMPTPHVMLIQRDSKTHRITKHKVVFIRYDEITNEVTILHPMTHNEMKVDKSEIEGLESLSFIRERPRQQQQQQGAAGGASYAPDWVRNTMGF